MSEAVNHGLQGVNCHGLVTQPQLLLHVWVEENVHLYPIMNSIVQL